MLHLIALVQIMRIKPEVRTFFILQIMNGVMIFILQIMNGLMIVSKIWSNIR